MKNLQQRRLRRSGHCSRRKIRRCLEVKKSNFRREWFWVLVIGFCIIEFKNYFIGVNQDKNVTGVGSKGGEELEAPSLETYWKRVAVKRGRGRKKKRREGCRYS